MRIIKDAMDHTENDILWFIDSDKVQSERDIDRHQVKINFHYVKIKFACFIFFLIAKIGGMVHFSC